LYIQLGQIQHRGNKQKRGHGQKKIREQKKNLTIRGGKENNLTRPSQRDMSGINERIGREEKKTTEKKELIKINDAPKR